MVVRIRDDVLTASNVSHLPMNTHALVLLSAAIALAVARDASAQAASPPRPTRVPVTVVMVSDLPAADGRFRIDRRTSDPRDVILLRADATADQLADAVRTLLVVRQIAGDTAKQPARMRMRAHQASPGPRREFPWVPRVLADLRRAELRDVDGVGRVRAVQVWLPPQHRRSGR